MIEYIKMIIVALVSGFMAPLPVSSAGHFSVIAKALALTDDESKLGFYFALFSVTFAVVIFVCLRKIYFKSFKALVAKNNTKGENLKVYKNVAKNILLSILPMPLLFIPVGGGNLIIDYFDKFLFDNGLYLVGVACIVNALILVVGRWYAKQENRKLKRVCGTMSVLRMSVYQIVSYIIPGFSHVASGSVNMLMSDVHPKVMMREVYLYLAPSMLIVNIAKIVKYLINDTIIDAVQAVIGIVVFAVMSYIVMKIVAKFNVRKLFAFFTVYSVILGIGAVVLIFVI